MVYHHQVLQSELSTRNYQRYKSNLFGEKAVTRPRKYELFDKDRFTPVIVKMRHGDPPDYKVAPLM